MSPTLTATKSSTSDFRFCGATTFQLGTEFPMQLVPHDKAEAEVRADAIVRIINRHPLEDGEARPPEEAVRSAVALIASVTNIPMPDVSIFFGEVQLTWRVDRNEVTLLSQAGSAPKLHFYTWYDERPSRHELRENATAQALKDAVEGLKQPL